MFRKCFFKDTEGLSSSVTDETQRTEGKKKGTLIGKIAVIQSLRRQMLEGCANEGMLI